MLEFTKLTLGDIEKIVPYFAYSTNRMCDNTVGGAFIWRDHFSGEYAIWNSTVVFKVRLKYRGGITAFTFPLGEDMLGCIEEVDCYCCTNGIPLVFCALTQSELPFLKTIYNNTCIYQESYWSDYLYNASDLISLAGRKYHGQKNHLNHFWRAFPNASFEIITGENVSEVRDFFIQYSETADMGSEILAEEYVKVIEVFDNFDLYGLLGGLIRVEGKVAAFSLGEVVGDTLFVHTEKADTSYRGIYQVMNNEFAKHYVTDAVNYINREEDDGDPGLRIAKQSYHPVELIEKYIVEIEGETMFCNMNSLK